MRMPMTVAAIAPLAEWGGEPDEAPDGLTADEVEIGRIVGPAMACD